MKIKSKIIKISLFLSVVIVACLISDASGYNNTEASVINCSNITTGTIIKCIGTIIYIPIYKISAWYYNIRKVKSVEVANEILNYQYTINFIEEEYNGNYKI